MALLFAAFFCARQSAPLVAADANEPIPTASGVRPALSSGQFQTPEKIALGAKLFSDPRLSIDGSMSCASCHDPAHAFTTPKPPVRPGVTDRRLRRDVPSLLNVAFATPLHHDGGEPTLEVQMLAPLFNEGEMGNVSFNEFEARIAAIPEYAEAFEEVFKGKPRLETIAYAIASFERSLVAKNSLFDTWQESFFPEIGSNPVWVSIAAEAGFALFRGKAGCVSCHAIDETSFPVINAMFTANDFLNTGIGNMSEAWRAVATPDAPTDRGREEITHNRQDRYKFRVPTLRNVELTAPYMHDGSIKSLEDVIAYYNAGGSTDPEKDPRIKPLGLTEEEQRQLLAFLKSLTSEKMPGETPGIQNSKP